MLLLKDPNLSFSPPPLEKFLKKYGEGKRRTDIEPLYQKMLGKMQEHAQPRYVYEAFPSTELPELHKWLPHQTKFVILGVCTLGHTVDERLDSLNSEDIVAQYVLNEIASEWIQRIALDLHRALRNILVEQKLKVGPPFRPGLGHWPLETQSTIFEKITADSIGVTLDETFLMTPEMSISFIIPVTK